MAVTKFDKEYKELWGAGYDISIDVRCQKLGRVTEHGVQWERTQYLAVGEGDFPGSEASTLKGLARRLSNILDTERVFWQCNDEGRYTVLTDGKKVAVEEALSADELTGLAVLVRQYQDQNKK